MSKAQIGIDDEYQAEAMRQARASLPRTRGLTVLRVTGDSGKSGMFQAYVPVPQRLGGGLNSVGDNFHISL